MLVLPLETSTHTGLLALLSVAVHCCIGGDDDGFLVYLGSRVWICMSVYWCTKKPAECVVSEFVTFHVRLLMQPLPLPAFVSAVPFQCSMMF